MTTNQLIGWMRTAGFVKVKRHSLQALLMLLCFSASITFAADALSQTSDFNIEPQGIVTALHEWSRQSNVQVMLASSDVADQQTDGVKGRLTAADALSRLLRRTNLSYEAVGDRTVAVKRLAQAIALEQAPSRRNPTQQAQPMRASDSADRAERPVEEVIVTAQKRAERLQDVPISISVLGGPSLDRATVSGVTEALSRVPGAAVNEANQGGGTMVVMRGVTASSALFAGSSPISYYLDSLPFGLVRQAIAPDTNAYDLERIEVLRGPQGTLFGASAQNGVVRVLTKDANLDALEWKVRGSTSNTSDGGWNYRGDMAVNVPLVERKLAARAVVGYQDLSGWIDRPNKKDSNDAEILNARIKLNARPTDELSIGLSSWISRADYGGPSIAMDNGQHVAVLDEPITTDFDMYGLKIGYDLDRFSISSMTSYLDYMNDSYQDLSPLVPGLSDETILDSTVFSQEVILTSRKEEKWRWTFGGMYRDGKDRQFQRNIFEGAFETSVDQHYTSESLAVFGELTRSFLDGRVELTGGLRYFEDEVTGRDDVRLLRSSSNFDAISPRLALTWHPNQDLTAYASYAEGFRSGFPQAGSVLNFAPQFPPVDADTLHNYEVGAKGSFMEGRASFDAAVYYIDWQDVQQSLTVPVNAAGIIVTVANVNSESASGVGVDLGMTFRPVQGVELGATVSWNDLAMDADVISGGTVLFEEGDRLNFSPEYTLGTNADLIFDIGSGGYEGRVSVSANYTSAMDVRTLDGGVQSIAPGDPITIGRASFALDAPANWVTTLYIDNFTNEQGAVARFPILRTFFPWDTRVRPRTVGVQFEYGF